MIKITINKDIHYLIGFVIIDDKYKNLNLLFYNKKKEQK